MGAPLSTPPACGWYKVRLNHLNVLFSSIEAFSLEKFTLLKRLSVALAMLAFAMKAPLTVVPLLLTIAGAAEGKAAKAE